MKSASEVLASMKPDESLVDKYLSSIEGIIDQAAKNGDYSTHITLYFMNKTNVDKNFARKAVKDKLVSLGYAVYEVDNDYFSSTIKVSWHPNDRDANTKDPEALHASIVNDLVESMLGQPNKRK